jgi:hypothetical protein
MKTFKTFNKEKDIKDFEEDIAAIPEKETETSSEKEKQEEKNENV